MYGVEPISVVMPVYNGEETVMKAIQSILDQTYKNIEVLIIDDASTDGMKEKLLSIKDERVCCYFCKENGGPSVARNIGIQKARYNYIAFADADDIWHKDKLEKQMRVLANDPDFSMVYCAYLYKKDHVTGKIPDDSVGLREGDIFDVLWKGNLIGTPTMLIKKEILFDVGGFDEKIRSYEDWELVLKIAKKYKIGYVDEILVDTDYSGRSGVNANVREQIRTLLFMCEKYKDCDCKSKIEEIMRDFVLNRDLPVEAYQNKILELTGLSRENFEWLLKIYRDKITAEYVNKILFLLQDERFTEIFRKCYGIGRKISVYGAGKLGLELIRKAKDIGIEIQYVLDRNLESGDDLDITNPENVNEEIDLLIVTVKNSLGAKNLETYYPKKAKSIRSIFEMVL